jgi:hypothetical protein
MASITNHNTTQVNIVIIPTNSIDINTIATDKIKSFIGDIYEDSKPIITQFPELLVVFDPNSQISINFIREQNKVVIADNKVTPYTGRDMNNFIKLVSKINSVMTSNNVKDFGFNILSVFDLENEPEDSGLFIKNNFIKTEKFVDKNIVSAGINIAYEAEGVRYGLKLEPRNTEDLSSTKSIVVNQNAHFAGEKLPEFSDLLNKCSNIYNDLLATLTAIIA